MRPHEEGGCFICRKHRGDILVPGGAVYEDALFYAGHASMPEGETTAYLGTILVEPKRHIAGLANMNPREAGRLGPLIAMISRALVAVEGAEHVYLFVFGHHVDHLHLWLVPRYPNTPREFWGSHVDEWPEAPRGRPDDVAALCGRVRQFIDAELNG